MLLHDWGCNPLHCRASDAHKPPQLPLMHALGHGSPMSCHCPWASHFCGWSPRHCDAPSTHPSVVPPPSGDDASGGGVSPPSGLVELTSGVPLSAIGFELGPIS